MLCCRGCATRASSRMAFADLRRIESTSTPGTKTENAMADLIKLETGHGPVAGSRGHMLPWGKVIE
jgi:hypothetical protein